MPAAVPAGQPISGKYPSEIIEEAHFFKMRPAPDFWMG
jgi:hypothetical protein